MKHTLKIGLIAGGILGFVLIRLFQNDLFYDPLIQFFKGNFQSEQFPKLEFWRYNLSLMFRFGLNTLLSLLIIWAWFTKKSYLVFASFLYAIVGVVAFILFWTFAHNISTEEYMKLFYIRRFLIQPIIVIVLIPAFYFQQISKKA